MDNIDREPHNAWLDQLFWDRLQRLETQHRRLQSACDAARRGLDTANGAESEDLRAAWKHYCEVIAELDQATADIEILRVQT